MYNDDIEEVLNMAKITLNLPDTLLEKIIEYAAETGLNKTSSIIALLTKGLQAEDGLQLLTKIIENQMANKPGSKV